LQRVATRRNSCSSKNGSNKPKSLLSVATSCADERR
jgi:hypothetical protein